MCRGKVSTVYSQSDPLFAIFYNLLKDHSQKGLIVLGLTDDRRIFSFGIIFYAGRSLTQNYLVLMIYMSMFMNLCLYELSQFKIISFICTYFLISNMSGWHICSCCEKAVQYMCYTCTYSVCKGCIKQGKFFGVRGNKGFCDTCFGTILLIESKDDGAKVSYFKILYFPVFSSKQKKCFVHRDMYIKKVRPLFLVKK